MLIAQKNDFPPTLGHRGDEFIELIERHPHAALHARSHRAFQGFLAREELMQSETSPALALLKVSCHDHIADVGHPLIELGEDQPRGRIDFEISPRKHLWMLWVATERE